MAEWAVPLSDLEVTEEDVVAVTEALRSGWWTMGPRVEAFESAFAEAVGAPHAVAVTNGTLALELMLLAVGVGPGDEVLVPAITFVATAAAVARVGATPVIVDILSEDEPWMDPAAAARAVGPATRAICFVSYAGEGGTLADVASLAESIGVHLVEDAAHGAGGGVGGRALGTLGLAGAFSLFSNKNLAVGEGGVVVTADDLVAERARLLRSHGMTSGTWARHTGAATAYDVVELGLNARMDEMRAALATARLPRLTPDVARRRAIAGRYRELLADTPLTMLSATDQGACHLFPVLARDRGARDELRAELGAAGIQSAIHYPALHTLTALRGERSFPAAESYAARTLSLPLFPGLTATQQQLVVETIKDP